MTEKRWCLLVWLGALVLFAPVGVSQAVVFPFDVVTTNGLYYNDPGVNLYMDVDNGEGFAYFTFYNDSTVDCSITNIYFDDGSLLYADSVIDGPIGTVDFEKVSGSPGDLPDVPGFNADREYNIGAVPPPFHNGINNIPAGEWVRIEFVLENGGTLQDVLGELADQTLKIGIHIQGFPDGSSESAVNNPVPEPATMLLFGLGALALLKKRNK